MKTLAMRTILGTAFAVVSLLPTLPAHAATGNIAVRSNDPIALAFQRTLEEPADPATTGQLSDPIAMAPLEGAGNCATTRQPSDSIALAYWRTLEGAGSCTTTVQPNDPIALAYWRTLEGFVDPATTGQPDDLMVGENVGGVNVSGGTVGLSTTGGTLVGSLGVSGDTSCTDHAIPWRLRKALGFGQVPAVHPDPDGSTEKSDRLGAVPSLSLLFHPRHAQRYQG